MRDNLRGYKLSVDIARRGMKPHGYTYKGGFSRLVRFSGLCIATRSTVVYHRAGSQCRINPSKQKMSN